MKNTQTLWDLLILLFIMCAGVASVKFLARNNIDRFDYRFPDKSLMAGAPELANNGSFDPNLEVSTLEDFWNYYLSPAEVFGMMYIQDYTCPQVNGSDMVIQVAGTKYVLNNDYESYRKTNMRDVVDDIEFTDLNHYPNTTYYLTWNSAEECWDMQYKKFEYNEASGKWEATR